MKTGDLIDKRYKLVREMGEGGFGKVFEAYHNNVGKRYALKCLLPEHTKNQELVGRFLREAVAASAIGSPHIVEVFDAVEGEGDRPPYFTMEYLEGESFEDLLPRHPLDPGRVVGLVRQACAGLEAAHAAQIFHRDIKPANFFVTTREGREWVKVLDFGAALFRSLSKLSVQRSAPWTPQYSSPEVFERTAAPDARSDIWSLGVTLYELLTGKLPFDATDYWPMLYQVTIDDPPSPCSRRPDLDHELEKIVLKTLAKQPDDRYQSMNELSEALRALDTTWYRTMPLSSRPPSDPSAPVQPSRPIPPTELQPTLPAPVVPPTLLQPTLPAPVILPPTQVQPAEQEPVPILKPTEVRELPPLSRVEILLPSEARAELVLLEKGSFLRGAREPLHEVILTRSFQIWSTPVTGRQFEAVMGFDPSESESKEPDLPVVSVSWFDAVAFCNNLSGLQGLGEAYELTEVQGSPGDEDYQAEVRWKGPDHPGFRLPTEAEWEYACRAGRDPARIQLAALAWFQDNSGGRLQPVRTKSPNDWGLCDMLGNVNEWVWDNDGRYPSGSTTDPTGAASGWDRIIRGGSCRSSARDCRPSYRSPYPPESRDSVTGFRPVLTFRSSP
jgi:serine/threonine protein kinase